MSDAASLSRRWFVAGVGVSILGAGCSDGAPARVPASDEILALEHSMHEAVNRDRAAAGMPPLAYDERLADIARAHALDMHQHLFFAHESPTTGTLDDRLSRASYLAAVARENLAEAPDVPLAEDGLMKSPHHHENLMATDVTHIGIGIVTGGVKDPRNLVFVQVFGRPVERQTPEEAKATVIERIAKARAAKGLGAATIDSTLDKLAASHLSDLPDAVPDGALENIGKAVLKEANRQGSILVTGARVISATEYDPPSAVLGPKVSIGVAAGAAKDDKGHDAMKILVIVAGS
ncbi:MAG TPA: CAP domain-containing protein [Polyangiaceae bacterium]|jgi:uncharacterized protein YkwD|nr:CAP domain-containing protein [Polyangiaceae bacterium]